MMSNTVESSHEPNPLQRLMQAPPKSRAAIPRPTTGKKAKTMQRPQTAKPR